MTRTCITTLAALLVAASLTGCLDETVVSVAPDAGATPAPSPTLPPTVAEPYASCSSDDECGSLRCVSLLGDRVCMTTGCAVDASVCSAQETCVISAGVEPSGVCAHTGAADFCARQCADALRCGLTRDCLMAECCGTLDANGCPNVCATLDPMACVIDPRCDPRCCGG